MFKVIEKEHFIIVVPPRSGSSTIQIEHGKREIDVSFSIRDTREKIQNNKSIVVVRNPVDRWNSAHAMKHAIPESDIQSIGSPVLRYIQDLDFKIIRFENLSKFFPIDFGPHVDKIAPRHYPYTKELEAYNFILDEKEEVTVADYRNYEMGQTEDW